MVPKSLCQVLRQPPKPYKIRVLCSESCLEGASVARELDVNNVQHAAVT